MTLSTLTIAIVTGLVCFLLGYIAGLLMGMIRQADLMKWALEDRWEPDQDPISSQAKFSSSTKGVEDVV